MHEDNTYPPMTSYDYNDYVPARRRTDLIHDYRNAVARALGFMFVHHLEVPHLWHYKRDAFSFLEDSGRSGVQFLDRDELWKLYELGIRFRAIYERNSYTTTIWEKIKARKEGPELSDAEKYLEDKLLKSICMMSIEAAAEGGDWLEYHYRDEIRRIKEEETVDEVVKKLPAHGGQDDMRAGPIMKLVQVSYFHTCIIEVLTSRHSEFRYLEWHSLSMIQRVYP
jgi:transcription elongation factor SPT6